MLNLKCHMCEVFHFALALIDILSSTIIHIFLQTPWNGEVGLHSKLTVLSFAIEKCQWNWHLWINTMASMDKYVDNNI